MSLKGRQLLQQKEASDVVAVFTEMIAQGLSGNVRAASRILQAFIQGRGAQQVEKELKKMREKGTLSKPKDPKVADLIWEMWRFIDEDVPDEDRVEAMKNLFKRGVSIEADEKERAEIYQLMKICRQLGSMEIMVLKACDELRSVTPKTNEERHAAWPNYVGEWAAKIHEKLAFGEFEMILLAEENLMRLKLITPRGGNDSDRITSQSTLRLTNLGIRLCRYIRDLT
jgi:hypothetical protein